MTDTVFLEGSHTTTKKNPAGSYFRSIHPHDHSIAAVFFLALIPPTMTASVFALNEWDDILNSKGKAASLRKDSGNCY